MLQEKFQGLQASIHVAASYGNIQRVEECLHQGIDVDTKDIEGYTPLARAAIKNQREVVDFLIVNGADLSAKSKDGHTPLYLAAVFESREVVDLLLTYGVSHELVSAALLGDIAFFKDYLRQGNDINCWKGAAPLEQVASLSGNQEVIELLLENGADVDAQTEPYGWTALHSASAKGLKSVVQVLIEHGAQINIEDKLGETPLHYAVSNGHQSIVELLIAYGADVNVVGNSGTPLYWTVEKGYRNIAEILIENGSNLNARNLRDDNRSTLLHLAVSKDDIEMVQLLLKNKIDINVRSGFWGYTPLYYAQSKQMRDLLKQYGLSSRMYKWAKIWHFIQEVLYTLSTSG